MACDPSFASVALLVLGNSSAGSTAFADSSPNAFTLSGGGTTQATAANALFGLNTISVGNTAVSTPNVVAAGPLDLGEVGTYTIECWVRPTTTGGQIFLGAGNFSTFGFFFEIAPTTVLVNVYDGATVSLNSGASNPCIANQWNHLALVNNGTTLRMYCNGVGGTVATVNTGTSWAGAPFVMGLADGSSLVGQLAEVRVSNGVARYTANFTPPTAPFPTINCTQTVPNLVGLGLTAALSANAAAGYLTTVQEQNHLTAPLGTVISQNPPAGSASVLGTNIILTFSAGPPNTAQMGGDVWGSAGGDQNTPSSPIPIGQALAYGTQQSNAVAFTNQSVLAALATGTSITQNTPATSVPTTPTMG